MMRAIKSRIAARVWIPLAGVAENRTEKMSHRKNHFTLPPSKDQVERIRAIMRAARALGLAAACECSRPRSHLREPRLSSSKAHERTGKIYARLCICSATHRIEISPSRHALRVRRRAAD